VARVVETYVGASAEADLDDLARWLGEPTTADGALLLIDATRRAEFHAEVRRSPVVVGVSERGALLASVRAMLADNLGATLGVTVVFSGVIALGVLYNAVRIQLAERSRDLASLRVLGFRRREVAAILTGEVTVLVALGLPAGLWLGGRLSELLVRSPGFDTEQFRLPYVIEPRTFALAALIVLLSAVACGWAARRRLDRFDLVSVLKARD
jgi:putative ABC transport system permease protein